MGSSGRRSRSWRRLRSAPSLPPSSKPHRIRTRICQLKLEENLTKCVTRLYANPPTTVKIQKLPRCRLQIPHMKQCFEASQTLPPLEVALGLLFQLQKVLCSRPVS